MGDETQHRPGPGGVPVQGNATDHREAYPASIVQALRLNFAGDGYAGIGV